MGNDTPGLAIISGGSSGIGKACAEQLVDRGHPVALLARDVGRLAAARADLLSRRPDAVVITESVDVGDWEACRAAVDRLGAVHGAAAWVIASAGMARPGLFLEQSVEDYAAHMQANYLGTLHLLKAAAPRMVEARRGRIVLVASGAAFVGIYGYSAYAPSKFAVRALAEVLRVELALSGISVTVACPPDTQTPQLAYENAYKPSLTRRITEGGGVWSADDVGAAIIKGALNRKFMVGPGVAVAALSSFHSLIAPIFRLRQTSLLRQEAVRGNGLVESPGSIETSRQ